MMWIRSMVGGMGWVAGGVLLCLSCPLAWAQGTNDVPLLAEIEPIADVRRDADQDGVPDRLGDWVTVAGWTTVESGAFHPVRLRVFLQDDSGGIALYAPAIEEPLERGQRLIVSGRVDHYQGLTQLSDLRLRLLPTEPRSARPQSVYLDDLAREAWEGRLVKVIGELLAREEVRTGWVLDLGPGEQLEPRLKVFLPDRIVTELDMERLQFGDRVDVVGVLVQRNAEEPLSGYYTLWPRDAGDVQFHGPSRTFYQRSWKLVVFGLVLSILWLTALRFQVRHKTRQLLESERRFRSVFEGAVDAIFLQATGGGILSCNPAARKLFDADGTQLVGQDFADRLTPGTRAQWEATLEAATASDPILIQGAIRTLAGKEMACEINVSMIDLEQHTILLIVTRDITDRLKVQEALRQEKERLSVILASIGDGVMAVNFRGEVIMMNRAAERLTGWKESRALGEPLDTVFALVDKASGHPFPEPAAMVFTKGSLVEVPHGTLLVDRNGIQREIIASLAPLRDPSNLVSGAVLAFRDITDQLRRDDEVTNAAKLESIGVLAGGIAHDFNNILTSVLGNLSLALNEGITSEEMKAALFEAEKAAQRTRDLTQQLLTFSKGGAPIRKTVDLRYLVRESAGFALSGSNVRCNFMLSDTLWPASVDEGQVIQVVNNLVINALESMPDGGRLEITADNHALDEQATARDVPLPAGRYVRITVSDCGAGIPKEHLSRIFDPYFTTKPTGSGLGLAATYSIVHHHDGYIKVDSREGVGTTFTMYLPASTGKVESRQQPRKRMMQGQGRVLVMDDEAAVRRVACSMLKRLGYESDEAVNGDEALSLYAAARKAGQPYSVVIMDLTIPGGMGGREAISRLQRIDPEVVAIVSSGYSNDLIMADFQQYGFSGVVVKPYDMGTLAEVLSDLVPTA